MPQGAHWERDRAIRADRKSGMTYRQLGKKYDLSAERCTQICLRDETTALQRSTMRMAELLLLIEDYDDAIRDPTSRMGASTYDRNTRKRVPKSEEEIAILVSEFREQRERLCQRLDKARAIHERLQEKAYRVASRREDAARFQQATGELSCR